MSESSSEKNPQILVNGEQQEQQQDGATGEGQISVGLEDERSEENVAAEKESQRKVQSVFQQVRNQIRSQVRAPKSSILELVQRVKDRETEITQLNSDPEGKDVSSEEQKQAEGLVDESKNEMELKEEQLCAVFEKKLEASKKALRDDFEVQISQVRKEMQAYIDQALKDLECKMQSRQSHNLQHPREQQEGKGPDKKLKPPTAPSLAARRGRVLTRTMTTIIPKTCAPVIIGPRAKSETLYSSKGESSRLLLRDPLLSHPGNKPCQCRKPLPPTCPPLYQRKKPARPKAKAGD
ncbi:hypothetical protein ABVT39_020246 [Epinephelus coioides]